MINKPTGVELIAQERARQLDQIGWTAEHDDMHRSGELSAAAVVYAMPEDTRRITRYGHTLFRILWPFDMKFWNPTPNDRVRELTIAGALIAAEIDRLNRMEP